MLQALPPPEPAGEVIVVTGKALPDSAAQRAAHVDLLDARRLADTASQTLDQILAQVPGIQLFRRSDSTTGHPTSQGVTLRALGGNASSRALLILDGVPQADPFGGWVNWPAYDPAGLDQVTVIRGAGSVSHGPGALAGVIELDSRARAGLDASLEGGSRESLRGHAYWGAGLAGGLLTIDAQGGRSEGFIPVTEGTRGPIDRPAPFEQASLRSRWIALIGNAVEMQLGALAFIDERERGVPFTGNRTRGADASVRFVGRGRWQWSALGYAQWRNFRSSFASVDDARTSATRVALQDSVPSRAVGGGVELRPPLGPGLDLRIGADARFATGDTQELFAFVDGDPTRSRIAGGQTTSMGVFVEGSVTRGPLTLSGGLRADRWRISNGELVERPLAGGPANRDDSYPDRTGVEPTARASAVVKLATGTDLRLSAYRGWRLPTLNELFRPFRAGPDATAANPLLGSEKLTGLEAGIRVRREWLQLDLTAFVNRLSGAIANVTLGQGPGSFPGVGFVAGVFRQRQNVDAVRVRGFEGSTAIVRGPVFLRLGASITHARVEADGPASGLDGLRPAQTPNLIATGALGWQQGERSASIVLRHVGAQYEDDLNEHRLPAATSVDAFLAWPIANRLQLIARAQNLLGENVVAGISDDGTVERATPRAIWLGLRFKSD